MTAVTLTQHRAGRTGPDPTVNPPPWTNTITGVALSLRHMHVEPMATLSAPSPEQ
jgi:hypothetical protein